MSGKVPFEDDGRTVADMSDLARPTPFGFRSTGRKARRRKDAEPSAVQNDRPWEEAGMSRRDRRRYIWGALSASLLIGLAFIVGLGLVILLIVLCFA